MIEIKIEIEKIFLSEGVRETILKYSNITKLTRKENGGILLGKVTLDHKLYIEIASEPNRYDQSSSFSFIRNRNVAQKTITKLWKNSNGILNYIGEWHTHPFPNSSPSSGDISMIRDALESNTNCFSFILLIISDSNGNISITLATANSIKTYLR